MFNNISAVIFDMDGTLIDSMWLWKAIDIEYLARYNIELPPTLQNEIEGMSFSETASYFKKRFSLEDDVETIKADWNQLAQEYYLHKVTLKDHVNELLSHLKNRNIKVGIGTSNSKELVKLVIERFGLKDNIDAIRTSCEVEKGKPSPDIFIRVAKDLDVEPSRCMVFEDVPNGLLAANNAGMRSVAVYDLFSEPLIERKKELAHYYIETFKEAIDALLKGTE